MSRTKQWLTTHLLIRDISIKNSCLCYLNYVIMCFFLKIFEANKYENEYLFLIYLRKTGSNHNIFNNNNNIYVYIYILWIFNIWALIIDHYWKLINVDYR
jgi:hypothetical protein